MDTALAWNSESPPDLVTSNIGIVQGQRPAGKPSGKKDVVSIQTQWDEYITNRKPRAFILEENVSREHDLASWAELMEAKGYYVQARKYDQSFITELPRNRIWVVGMKNCENADSTVQWIFNQVTAWMDDHGRNYTPVPLLGSRSLETDAIVDPMDLDEISRTQHPTKKDSFLVLFCCMPIHAALY